MIFKIILASKQFHNSIQNYTNERIFFSETYNLDGEGDRKKMHLVV